jgi:hypothetical protein
MDIPKILTIAVLGVGMLNFLHWRGPGEERFLYFPQTGWLRFIFAAWIIATFVTAILFLTGVISVLPFLSLTLGLSIAHVLYSIVRRRSQRVSAS